MIFTGLAESFWGRDFVDDVMVGGKGYKYFLKMLSKALANKCSRE